MNIPFILPAKKCLPPAKVDLLLVPPERRILVVNHIVAHDVDMNGTFSGQLRFFGVSLPKIGVASVRRRNGRWLFSYMRWIEAMEISYSHQAGQRMIISPLLVFSLSLINLHEWDESWEMDTPKKCDFCDGKGDSLSWVRPWNCTGYNAWKMNLTISKCMTVDRQHQNGHQLGVFSCLVNLF